MPHSPLLSNGGNGIGAEGWWRLTEVLHGYCSFNKYWLTLTITKKACECVCVHMCTHMQEGLLGPPGHDGSPALPVVLYLDLIPSPLQAQEGGRAKEEWTVGRLQPSSLTWLDHLALPAAQSPCASRKACLLPNCPLCSLQALCVWIFTPLCPRSYKLLVVVGPWRPLPLSKDCYGHLPQEAQIPISPPVEE